MFAVVSELGGLSAHYPVLLSLNERFSFAATYAHNDIQQQPSRHFGCSLILPLARTPGMHHNTPPRSPPACQMDPGAHPSHSHTVPTPQQAASRPT